MHSLLSGDGGWQVRDTHVEKKRCRDGSQWDAVPEASQRLPVNGEAAITNQLHDQADHAPVRPQSH